MDTRPASPLAQEMASTSSSRTGRAAAFNVCAPMRVADLLRAPPARRTRRMLCKCTVTPTAKPSSRPATPLQSAEQPTPERLLKIACVGDIHGMWNENDETALRGLRPDLALFVGDYGDEDVRVTQRVANFAASVDFGVATVFGNHDAQYTASSHKRTYAPYNVATTCRVSDQMRMLAPYDVSYRSAAFDALALSVCGGRAFSFGGPNWKYKQFYLKFLGVSGMEDSRAKLALAATQAQHDRLVFLSHSGPVGLGARPEDPCGKDWGDEPGGDYGDVDLRHAMNAARSAGMRVPLVVFGHMHQALQGGSGERVMVTSERDGDSDHDTVMVNAAVVPRHRTGRSGPVHHFQMVYMRHDGDVDKVEESWVAPNGRIATSCVLYEVAEAAAQRATLAVTEEA